MKINKMLLGLVVAVFSADAMQEGKVTLKKKSGSFILPEVSKLIQEQLQIKKEKDTYEQQVYTNRIAQIQNQHKVLQMEEDLYKVLLKKKKIDQTEFDLQIKKIGALREGYDLQADKLCVDFQQYTHSSFEQQTDYQSMVQLYQDALKKILILSESYQKVINRLDTLETGFIEQDQVLSKLNSHSQDVGNRHNDLDKFVATLASRTKSLEFMVEKHNE